MIHRLILLLAISAFISLIPCVGAASEKIAIIKADDVRRITPKWNRFFEISKAKGVKVSAGIICNSLTGEQQAYVKWLKKHAASGEVEFWNHGWDHKRWEDGGKQLREFSGTGYKHQKKHFEDSQKLMNQVFGFSPVAFGAPFNAIDADTAKVLNENADVRLFFGYNTQGLKDKVLARMSLNSENNGTGKPDFDKFKDEYVKKKEGLSFVTLQFHPASFSDAGLGEYAKILDFMIAEGWTFMLPADYLARIDEAESQR